MRSVGIDCSLYGNQSKSGDILLPNDKKLSVKGAFTGGATNIRLINKMGGGKRVWDTATLFVISGVGIVFGAPNMVEIRDIVDTGDGVQLKKMGLDKLMKNPENLFDMKIIEKPATEVTTLSRKASSTVAKQILSEMEESALLRNLSGLEIGGMQY